MIPTIERSDTKKSQYKLCLKDTQTKAVEYVDEVDPSTERDLEDILETLPTSHTRRRIQRQRFTGKDIC